jgi:hypothetical protein
VQILVPNRPLITPSSGYAVKLVTTKGRQRIHITVLGTVAAQQVNIAHDQSTLESLSPLVPPGSGGISILQSTGTVEVEWEGDLWALGAATNTNPCWIEFDCTSTLD